MSKIKEQMATRCELALMGKVVECNNNEVQAMTEYILSALGKEQEFADLDILKIEYKDIVKRMRSSTLYVIHCLGL